MPLAINDKILSREEVCKKYSIDIAKIVKRPEFESKRSFIDAVNGGKRQYASGSSVLARILSEDKDSHLPVEIRYYVSRKKDKEGDWQYEPYRIEMAGNGMVLGEDLDLAVFTYLHPTNELSPFHKDGSKAQYEFIDTTARAQKKVNSVSALAEAIVHAQTIKGDNARILAKGLGIPGVEPMEELEVTAALLNYAQANPVVYLQKKSQRITMIEGQITHFIDKGIFQENRVGNVRRWVWTAGPKTGETIVDLFNTTINSREALKNHIFGDIDNYLFLLNNMNDSISAREHAIRALEEMKDEETGETIGNDLPEHLKRIGQGGKLPTTFKEGLEYLTGKMGKRPSNTQASAIFKGVTEGSITDDNVEEWMLRNCKVVSNG